MAWRGSRTAAAQQVSAEAIAQAEGPVVSQQHMVAEVVKRGGCVIAGTDSPIFPHGLALLMQVEHYAMGGLTPIDAMRTATAVPAEAFGVGADIGTIERGNLADLVVVDGNPLVNVSDIRRRAA